MREIKFRCWNKLNKKYLFWNEILKAKKGADGIKRNYPINILNDEDYIFEQYTGSKDKNGKEIYEGDIVLRDGLYAEFPVNSRLQKTHQIIFEEGSFMLSNSRTVCCESSAIECIVIGNIYENSNLIKIK